MTDTKKSHRFQILDGTALKMIAMVCMLIDHAEGLIFFEQDWMICVGRIAFPIFAFHFL